MSKRFSSARSRVLGLLCFGVTALTACDEFPSTAPVERSDGPVTVALLVPGGSGESGDEVLARSLENAARLAITDLGETAEIELKVYQTRGNPEMAAFQAVTAVNDGAKVILGPVFAQSAVSVGAALAERNISILSFSNNTDVAGGNVFVLGSTFQNTANRMVNFAAAQGRNRMIVAHAETTAGQAGATAVSNALVNAGSQLLARNSYPLSQEDVISSVSIIRETIDTSGANALVLTSDTFGELPLLAQLLPEAGIDTEVTKFIGLTRWDIPASTLALPGLQGGWFALPDPDLSAAFEARYIEAFSSGPHPLAGLAYDGVAAIGALAAAGNQDNFAMESLTQPAGFAGVGGVFRLLPDGTNERSLAIAEIQGGEVVIVDPAPRAFGLGGF